MGLYGFKSRFVPLIERGLKTHTIRARRKFEDHVGDVMHLYFGLRTSSVRLLARTPCIQTGAVLIPDQHRISINHAWLLPAHMDSLAIHDGFLDGWEEMVEFFEDRFPFEGRIYTWTPLRREH